MRDVDQHLIEAAIANVDAWRASVASEHHEGRQSRDLVTRSLYDADHYEKKAAAKTACVVLCAAVDAHRKAGA